MAITLLVFVSLGFRPAQSRETLKLPPSPQREDYASTLLVPDLRALREDLAKMRRADKRVAYRGYESRIYRYLTGKLAKNNCEDISELILYSDDTAKGFMAQGVCLAPGLRAAELTTRWVGDKALVEIADEGTELEIDLAESEAETEETGVPSQALRLEGSFKNTRPH
jgi:hypothetical protein